MEKLIYIVNLRLSFLCKAKWPCIVQGISKIVSDPSLINVFSKVQSKIGDIRWLPQIEGVLKFIVDDAARGQPGLASIGGVLRDCNSRVLIVSSKSIGVAESNLADLMAVKEALVLLSSS
ncbi:hypothetical protein PTKIN_Ptkin09bG0169800 [Pterospermum kingtungense]